MKKLETLAKELEAVTAEDLREIIGDNENIDVDTLAESEKFCVLVYRELAKDLKAKGRTLVLDCNYPKSNFHEKSEKQLAKGQAPQWLVNYYRILDDMGNSMIQVYTKHVNPTKGEIAFDICTSSAKLNREQFEALEEELRFVVQRRKDGSARTTRRNDISYEGLKEMVKIVYAVLTSTENAKAEARRLKEEAKAEAKKAREEKEPENAEPEAVAV